MHAFFAVTAVILAVGGTVAATIAAFGMPMSIKTRVRCIFGGLATVGLAFGAAYLAGELHLAGMTALITLICAALIAALSGGDLSKPLL